MSERVFDNIPEREVVREGWREFREFLALASRARATSWGLPMHERYLLGVLVQLEESEIELAQARERIAALETVIEEQSARIRGLEMTIGRMKKRKEASSE